MLDSLRKLINPKGYPHRNAEADNEVNQFVSNLAHNVYERDTHTPVWARAILIILFEIYKEVKKR